MGGGYSSGNAAQAYTSGIGTTLTLFGFSLSMILIGKYLVPGVGRFTGVSTVGGIIGVSYGRSARILAGLFSFICCAGVVGAQMESMGMVFHVLLGVPEWAGILIGCGIMAYTLMLASVDAPVWATIEFVMGTLFMVVGVWCVYLAGMEYDYQMEKRRYRNKR